MVSTIAHGQSPGEITEALERKGYALNEVLGRSDRLVLVSATPRSKVGGRYSTPRMLVLHNIPTDAPFFTREHTDDNGARTAVYDFMDEISAFPAVQAQFRVRDREAARCGGGVLFREKPQASTFQFLYHHLLSWTFTDHDEETEPALFMTRTENEAPLARARLVTRPYRFNDCAYAEKLTLKKHYAHDPSEKSAAETCVHRYTTGTHGKRLSKAEAAARCPGAKAPPAQAVADTLAKTQFRRARKLAGGPDMDLYATLIGHKTEYALVHKIDFDTPLPIFERDEFGDYRINRNFEKRLVEWGVFPELAPDQAHASVKMNHYIQGFHNPLADHVNWPIISTSHGTYSEDGYQSYPRPAALELPPLSARAVAAANGKPLDWKRAGAAVEALPSPSSDEPSAPRDGVELPTSAPFAV